MSYQLSSSSDWHESGDDVYYKPLTGGNYTGVDWHEDTVAAIEVSNTNSYVATLEETQDYNQYLNVSEKIFTANAGTDVITCAAHGLLNDETVRFKGSDLPDGLVQGTLYFVRDRTADTFKVAATSGGAAINLIDAGSGTMVLNAPSLRSSSDQKIRVISASAAPPMTAEGEEALADAILAAFLADGDFGTSGLIADAATAATQATTAATQTAPAALRTAMGLESANLANLVNAVIGKKVVTPVGDGRFDIAVRNAADSATLVTIRHNPVTGDTVIL